MRDLNKAQLENELMRRWGKKGYAEKSKHRLLKPERDLIRTLYAGVRNHPEYKRHDVLQRTYLGPCSVGYISNVVFAAFHIEGNGDTWREAFAEVDRRKALATAQYEADRASHERAGA